MLAARHDQSWREGMVRKARRAARTLARRMSPVRFSRDRSGVTAIEFALIGPIHIALLLSMMETGLILTKVALLDLGVSQASKSIYIGAATNGSVSRDDIKRSVCDYVDRVQPDCFSNLIIELTEISDFDEPPSPDVQCQEVGSDEDIEPTVTYNPGSTSSVVYLRVCLTTNIVFPGIGAGLHMTKTDTGKYEIVTATAFMNEPF